MTALTTALIYLGAALAESMAPHSAQRSGPVILRQSFSPSCTRFRRQDHSPGLSQIENGKDVP